MIFKYLKTSTFKTWIDSANSPATLFPDGSEYLKYYIKSYAHSIDLECLMWLIGKNLK